MSLSSLCEPAHSAGTLSSSHLPKFNQNHTRTKLYKQASQLARHIAWKARAVEWTPCVRWQLIGTGSKRTSAGQRLGKQERWDWRGASNYPGAHSDIRGWFFFPPSLILYDNRENAPLVRTGFNIMLGVHIYSYTDMYTDGCRHQQFMYGLHTCEPVFFGLSQHADLTSDGFLHDSYETIEKTKSLKTLNTIKTMQSEH